MALLKKNNDKKTLSKAKIALLAIALIAFGGLATYGGTYAVHAATESHTQKEQSDGDGETNDDAEAATPGDPVD